MRLRVDDKIAILRRLDNYVADFEFPDIDKATKKEYKQKADAIKYELKIEDGVSGLTKKYKKASEAAVVELYKAGKTQREIEKLMGVSIATVNRALKNAGVRKSDK